MEASISSLCNSTRISIQFNNSRCINLLSNSYPFLLKFKSTPQFHNFSTKTPSSIIRSEITTKSIGLKKPDDKLRAIRELFSKPGIGIDAYIIPSQDAHQVAETRASLHSLLPLSNSKKTSLFSL
ncbi:Xaa-Pro aminopeptidase [Ranunculus cassubicifolius]